ncbi:MAG TPA: HutD family protein [Caulobacteraceae bacterium]
MIRIIEAAQQPVQRWKNGGGSTTQIVSYPSDASLDDFDWRVSMARMETDGPFSLFPGIDRTLAILQGDGVVLDIDGAGEITITQLTPPASFPGDRPTQARLLGGPITDLNVMTRRGRYRHRLQSVAVNGIGTVILCADATVALCLGDLDIRIGEKTRHLNSNDAAVLAGIGTITLSAKKTVPVWLVHIQAVTDA